MGTEPAATEVLGILAGSGSLPRRVAEAAVLQGRPVFIVAFHGQTDAATVDDFPHIWVRLGEAGRTIAELKNHRVADLVMAGAIRRPSVAELGLDWRGAQLFARIGARAVGDDGLLRAVSRELERDGFRVLGADQVLASATVAAGVPGAVGALGRHRPDDQAVLDIARGVEVARTLGAVDVGQTVVVQQGLVLGVEAIEGTDALLRRVGGLSRAGPGGVMVKMPKPRQDRRIDLPTIGAETIRLAAAAGLRGVAVESGGAILVDQEETVRVADEAGLFLIAVDPATTAADG